MSDPEIRVSPDRARGGWRGLPVLYVLVGGLVLAGLAWLVVEFVM